MLSFKRTDDLRPMTGAAHIDTHDGTRTKYFSNRITRSYFKIAGNEKIYEKLAEGPVGPLLVNTPIGTKCGGRACLTPLITHKPGGASAPRLGRRCVGSTGPASGAVVFSLCSPPQLRRVVAPRGARALLQVNYVPASSECLH